MCDGRSGSSCYVIFPELLTWQGARNSCEAAGGHLATIESQEENDVIQNIAVGKFTMYCKFKELINKVVSVIVHFSTFGLKSLSEKIPV